MATSYDTISRSALHFLSGTLLSRVTGVCRDITMAWCFGSHPALCAFMVAFRFANLLRRLFGEGVVSASFVPHFESLRGSSPEQGAIFFRDLFATIGGFLILLIGAVELCLGVLMAYGAFSPGAQEILSHSMIILPGILFICLFGLSSSLLQCEKRYFLAGVSPVAFNLVWIVALFLLKNRSPEDATPGLSLAISVALFLQWLVTMPECGRFLRRFLSLKQIFSFQILSPEVKGRLPPFFLSIFGIGAVQINTALDSLFARASSLEGPAFLWYSIRIEQVPLALFGIALTAALLPPLSRALQEGDLQKYRGLLSQCLKNAFSLMFPSTLAVLVVGAATVNMLYGHGDFSLEAIKETTYCLWGYALGLVPSSFVMLYAASFYAQKDYRTPMLASLFSVSLNIFLNALLVFILNYGPFSIALATSLSSFFNWLYLHRALQKTAGRGIMRAGDSSFMKTLTAALIAAVATCFLSTYFLEDPTGQLLLGRGTFPRIVKEQLIHLFIPLSAFALFFLSCAWILKLEEFFSFFRLRNRPLA